jgi:proline dehydrogenase
MAEPHRTKYDFEDRVARLEARLQDMQPSLDRLAQLENRLSHMYVLADRDRDRLDWTLAAIEGVVAEIDIYHAARETEDYAAAYTHTEPLVSVCVATMDRSERWLAKFEHWDKWNFCLNSAMMPANRRDYDEAYPP